MLPSNNDTKIILRKMPDINPKEELKKSVIKSLFNFINMDMENHKEFEKLNSVQQNSNNNNIQININLNIEVKINKQVKKKSLENFENQTKKMEEEKIDIGFKIGQNRFNTHVSPPQKIYKAISNIIKPPTILLKKPKSLYDKEIPIMNFKNTLEENKVREYKPKIMKIMHINKSVDNKSIDEKKNSLQSSISENEEIEIRSEIIEAKNNLIIEQHEENNKPIYELDAYFYYLVGKIGTYWKGASKTCPNPFKKKMFFNDANEEDDKMIEIFDLSHKFIPDFKQTF